MSRNQRPKIDEYPDYLFIVLHFPIFDKQVGRLNAGELDLFVGPDYIITLPNQPLKPVEYLFERCRSNDEVREQLFSNGTGYLLYQIVDQSFDYCFPMLRKIGNKLEQLEEDIFVGRGEEIVRDISNVKQEIINFRKTIRPQRTVLRDLERTKQRYMRDELEVYFDDIVDASERIWDMLENYKEVVEALEDTNESVISHRVNDILRVLTSISVIVLPLTFLASIWGMNVGVPGEGDDTAFWIIDRRDVRDAGRNGRVLPPAWLVVDVRDARQAVIEAPVDAVWELVGDPRRHPEWFPRVVEVKGTRFEEGDQYAQVTKQRFGTVKTDFVIERMENMREIRLACQKTGMYAHWLLTDAQGSTFVDVEMGMQPTDVRQPGLRHGRSAACTSGAGSSSRSTACARSREHAEAAPPAARPTTP